MKSNHSSAGTNERRSRVRFPLTVQLNYRRRSPKKQAEGAGESVNISSFGLLFVAQHELAVGDRLELSLEWPASLEGMIPLRLCVFGRIVRVEGRNAAVSIDHHEFRTARRKVTAAESPVRSSMTG